MDNIYTSSDGTKKPATELNNFQLVNGLLKNTTLCSQLEGEANLQAQENVKVLKEEILRRLAPKFSAEQKGEIMEALNHMDELADRGADEGEEKSELQKSYNFLCGIVEKI